MGNWLYQMGGNSTKAEHIQKECLKQYMRVLGCVSEMCEEKEK